MRRVESSESAQSGSSKYDILCIPYYPVSLSPHSFFLIFDFAHGLRSHDISFYHCRLSIKTTSPLINTESTGLLLHKANTSRWIRVQVLSFHHQFLRWSGTAFIPTTTTVLPWQRMVRGQLIFGHHHHILHTHPCWSWALKLLKVDLYYWQTRNVTYDSRKLLLYHVQHYRQYKIILVNSLHWRDAALDLPKKRGLQSWGYRLGYWLQLLFLLGTSQVRFGHLLMEILLIKSHIKGVKMLFQWYIWAWCQPQWFPSRCVQWYRYWTHTSDANNKYTPIM